MKNVTKLNMFILMGFADDLEVQVYIFLLFLEIYLFTLVGNLGLVMLVIVDSRIQNPMYYFLSVLSFLDALVTSKMLINFLSENKTVSYLGCAAQKLLFVASGPTECSLLAAMAYDFSMAPSVYVPLSIASYVGGILHATVHTVATFSLSFCASSEIRHVFCDIPPLLTISRSDTHTNQLLLFCLVGSIEMVTVLIVLISYGFTLLAILRMCSAEGRRKVFYTCGSHLTGVSIYHGTILFTYMKPTSSYDSNHGMIVSTFYTIIIPMLNPIIYSLRNKDVKEAMKNLRSNWF
uniref:G-protein coupled receptors family 1 profile domain-containing protein n=1 Tax=Capra hircus TaxID=9925 RepID=A0A452E8U2_CAPHI